MNSTFFANAGLREVRAGSSGNILELTCSWNVRERMIRLGKFSHQRGKEKKTLKTISGDEGEKRGLEFHELVPQDMIAYRPLRPVMW